VSIHTPHGSVALGAFYGSLIGLLLFWCFLQRGSWADGSAYGRGALIGEAMKRTGLDEELVDQVKSELTPGPQRSC